MAPKLSADSVGALRGLLRGPVLAIGDPGYDEARKLYNGMIDKRPGAIARVTDAGDVIACVNFARDNGIDLAVRGGGHSAPGLGSVNDGLVIDLSGMRNVRVDPGGRIAYAGGGALLGDVDHATGAFGLATPVGILSTTGIGGLTLGGGIGNLTRGYGLTIDNLLEADVVTADGGLVKASEKENADLFWAIRGGGGNFGVVTNFTLRLHSVPMVKFGPTFWSLDDAAAALRAYRDYLPTAPETLGGWFAFLTVPPVPLFPAELHGRKVAAVVWTYTGDPDKADDVVKPVTSAAKPLLHAFLDLPPKAMNSMFDALYPPGTQQYWRADFLKDIPDASIPKQVEWGRKMPTPQTTTHLYPVDGAASRVGKDDTAWAHRDATWAQVYFAVDPDPAKRDELRNWAVGYFEAIHPYSMGGAYVNFMMEEGQERVQATYGSHYERLTKIKGKYDPKNVFHVNQNIKPGR